MTTDIKSNPDMGEEVIKQSAPDSVNRGAVDGSSSSSSSSSSKMQMGGDPSKVSRQMSKTTGEANVDEKKCAIL